MNIDHDYNCGVYVIYYLTYLVLKEPFLKDPTGHDLRVRIEETVVDFLFEQPDITVEDMYSGLAEKLIPSYSYIKSAAKKKLIE